MTTVVDHLVELYLRLHRLESRHSNAARKGTVAEVDTATQKVRLRIGGTDEKPFLSPWVPYGQIAGVGEGPKFHIPPVVGQTMTLVSPSGDLRQSVAHPYTWSDEAPSPGSTADPVFTYGQVRADIQPEKVRLVVGPATIEATPSKITVDVGGEGFVIEGGKLKMTSIFEAKDKLGKPAHYVTGLDSGGDQAVDGQATVIL